MFQNKASPIQLTEFDIKTIGNSTHMIKAVIPFLDPSEQKLLGLMVRAMELNMTIDFFKKSSLSCDKQILHDNNAMLNEIKKFCPPEEQKQLDMMMNMMKSFALS